MAAMAAMALVPLGRRPGGAMAPVALVPLGRRFNAMTAVALMSLGHPLGAVSGVALRGHLFRYRGGSTVSNVFSTRGRGRRCRRYDGDNPHRY